MVLMLSLDISNAIIAVTDTNDKILAKTSQLTSNIEIIGLAMSERISPFYLPKNKKTINSNKDVKITCATMSARISLFVCQ